MVQNVIVLPLRESAPVSVIEPDAAVVALADSVRVFADALNQFEAHLQSQDEAGRDLMVQAWQILCGPLGQQFSANLR